MAEIVQSRPEPSSLRLVLSLAITGLLSGIVLVGMYLTTAPRIERNQAEAMTRAVYKVLPGTTRIAAYEVIGSAPVAYDGPEGTVPKGEALFAGYDQADRLVGYAVPAEGAGFQDTIRLLYGYDPARDVIVGMEVLDSRETPGLGDKIIHDPEFHANFVALEVAPSILSVKKGAKQNPNEVDAITGATISSDAVVKILNTSIARWRDVVEAMPAMPPAGEDSP